MSHIDQTDSITDQDLVTDVQPPVASCCPSFKDPRDDDGPSERCVSPTANGHLDGTILHEREREGGRECGGWGRGEGGREYWGKINYFLISAAMTTHDIVIIYIPLV